MSRNDSIEALNAATTATSRIDTVLAGQEGLDVDPDITWVPGDPLFEQPYDNDYAGNYRQPVSRCRDCDVNWETDDPCWMCGQERPYIHGMYSGNESSLWDLINSMTENVYRPRPRPVFTREMAERIHGMFREIGPSMEEAGRNMRTAMEAWQGLNIAFDVETIGVDQTPDFITYAVRDVNATMRIFQLHMRDEGLVPIRRTVLNHPRQFGGNRMLQLILDEANPPEPPEPEMVDVTWEGTTIRIPREIDMTPRIPLPDRIIENTISVPEHLVRQDYPSSRVVTQERRGRNA